MTESPCTLGMHSCKMQEVLEWAARFNRKPMLDGQLVHHAHSIDGAASLGGGGGSLSNGKGRSGSDGMTSVALEEPSLVPCAPTIIWSQNSPCNTLNKPLRAEQQGGCYTLLTRTCQVHVPV